MQHVNSSLIINCFPDVMRHKLHCKHAIDENYCIILIILYANLL